jgi:hypothetical protein
MWWRGPAKHDEWVVVGGGERGVEKGVKAAFAASQAAADGAVCSSRSARLV